MKVQAQVNVSLSTWDVDQHKSISAAVAEQLMVDVSELADLDDWTWHYESNAEYAWATAREQAGISPFTGEPFTEDDES